MLRTHVASLFLFALLAAPASPPQAAPEPRALRILVTNDDGIDSKGLSTLVRELARLGEVVVSAPDGNRSGSSHATTLLHEPVTVTRESVEGGAQAFGVSGTTPTPRPTASWPWAANAASTSSSRT